MYENYTYNDGRTVGMIKLTGTVPIYFSNVKYNIPMTLWISERYPNQPPFAYVTPLDNMIIKENHSYVDPTGMVRTPYFLHWHPERCDLVGMVEEMTQIFGNEPPLFARPPRSAPSYSQPSPTPIYHPPVLSSGGQEYPTGSTSRPDVVMQTDNGQGERFTVPHPPQQKTWTGQGSGDAEAAKQQFRKTVVTVLKDRLLTSIRALEQNTGPKSAQMEEAYQILMTRAQEIQQGIGLLQEERQTYEHNVRIMALIVGEMTEWSNKIHIPEGSSVQEVRAEDVIVPQDAVAAQFLKAQAEDLAAEDVLNILDQMLQKEVIDLDNYLKQVCAFW